MFTHRQPTAPSRQTILHAKSLSFFSWGKSYLKSVIFISKHMSSFLICTKVILLLKTTNPYLSALKVLICMEKQNRWSSIFEKICMSVITAKQLNNFHEIFAQHEILRSSIEKSEHKINSGENVNDRKYRGRWKGFFF